VCSCILLLLVILGLGLYVAGNAGGGP
jgi:hypothetical protein